MVKFQNIAIIVKIAIPAAIIATVAIGIVLYASLAVAHLSNTASTLADKNGVGVQYSLTAESNFNSAAVSEKNAILSVHDEKAIKDYIALYNKATEASLAA